MVESVMIESLSIDLPTLARRAKWVSVGDEKMFIMKPKLIVKTFVQPGGHNLRRSPDGICKAKEATFRL